MKKRPYDPWRNPPPGMIAVGEVLTTQGNKGEVKVASLTDTFERWLELKRVMVYTDRGQEELFLEKVRAFKGFVIVKFQGLTIPRAKLPGRFYGFPKRSGRRCRRTVYVDQVPLKVETMSGRPLGTWAVLFTGGNDVYLLRGGADGEILLPALKSVVRFIDPEAGIMRVELPPGLVDEEEER